jgi:hypothetical protein
MLQISCRAESLKRLQNRPHMNALASAAAPVLGGIKSLASHDDSTTTTCRKTTRRRREVAQILQRLPADDRLRKPHPVPRSTQLPLEIRELQASVSPTPLSSTPAPPRRPHRNLALLQICIRHHRVDVKSSTGSEAYCSELLLLLRGDLALGRRLLLRGGLRLRCLLHHTALLAKA